ncbi:hypothetical protein pb186bvf_017510 [Paramecium bursaria]
MAGIFYQIGYTGSKYPCLVVLLCVTITGILSLGIYNLRILTDPQDLWVSPNSRTYKEQEDFSSKFGPFYRINQMMLTYTNDHWVNIFRKEALQVVYFMQNIINSRSTLISGKNYTIEDLCFRPVQGKGCLAPSPMDIWLQDPKLLEEDADIQFTTLCTQSIDINFTNIPCSDRSGIPVILESVFGGISCEQRRNDTQPCDHCYIQAKTLSVNYLLNNDKFTQIDAQVWEKEVFIDTVQALNNRDYQKLYKYYQSDLMTAPTEAVLDNYKVLTLSERSIPDEIDEETNQNQWIVIISYLMMFAYIGLAIGQFPSKIYNGFTLGLGGILIVFSAMLSSIGAVSYLGIGMTMISLEVIPFLILAIGVDNMFIISHGFKKQKGETVSIRMGKTLESVGPSITTAAVCETLAFLVGALTKMPALQSFCIQAAIGVFLDFIFQITMFVAFLTWDELRKKHKTYDLMICKQDLNYEIKEDRKLVQNFFKKTYTPFLQKPGCVAITVLVFLLLLIPSFIGITSLEVGLEEQVSLIEGSYLYNYFTYEKKYIEIGPVAYVVLDGFNYQNDDDLKFIDGISNAISNLKETVQPPLYNWVSAFKLFIQPGSEWQLSCKTGDIQLDDFPKQLKRFLATKINSPCCQKYGICGEQFETDIVTNDEGQVTASRLRFQHTPLHNSKEYILSLEQTRQVIDKKCKDLDTSKKVYAYSLHYVFYDQYSYIRSVAIGNVLLALATIFFTMTIVQDVVCAIIVTFLVFLIAFNLIGMVWLCNFLFGGFQIEINAISVVNLVTCIGLAVEFVAHIVIKFRTADGNRWDRVLQSMTTMGTSVFVGIVCTKLIGVAVLGFAPSNLFKLYYFRMYILMVILGTFNGLVLLPTFLGIAGPSFSSIGQKYNKLINRSSNDEKSEKGLKQI